MQLLTALLGFFIGKKNWQRDQEIKKLIEQERKKQEDESKVSEMGEPIPPEGNKENKGNGGRAGAKDTQ